MSKRAQLADGTILEFPDETPDAVMDRAVKNYVMQSATPAAPAAPAATTGLGQPQTISRYRPMQAALGLGKNVARETLRQAPEVGGMMAGGAIGGMVGGPPGAVVGSGAGALAGTNLRQALQRIFPKQFGTGPASTGEALSEQLTSTALGTGGEGGGQLLTKGLSRYVNPRLSAEIQAIIANLEKNKIPYTAGDIREGGGWQIMENLMRGTLLGGTRMMRHTTNAAKKLWEYKERMLNDIGPLIDKDELGRVLAQGADKRHGELMGAGGVFERLYSGFDQTYKTPIDTAYIRKESQKILDEVRRIVRPGVMPHASSPESPSRFLNTLTDMASMGKTVDPASGKVIDVPVTYKDVWGVKKVIDGMLRSQPDDPLRTEAKGTLKRLHSILDEAMERSAQDADPIAAQAIRSVNKSYSEAKHLYETESLVKDIGKMDPERIVARYFGKESVTPADDLISSLSLQDRNRLMPYIQRRKIQDIFEAATKAREDLEVTSGSMVRSRFRQNEPMLKRLFDKDPEKWEALQMFMRTSERSQASGAMINPSSGRQLLAYSQLGSAAQWIWAGVGGAAQAGLGLQILKGDDAGDMFMRTGAYVIGPWVLARMLTNPRMASFLGKGFTMSQKQAVRSGWIPRVIAMAKMIEKNQAPQGETGQPNAQSMPGPM